MFCYTENMKPNWRYEDIIDLEYFIQQDRAYTSQAQQLEIRQRDRRIYQDCIRQTAEESIDRNRRFLLHQWMNRRREEEKACGNAILPGRLVEEIYVRLGLILFITGLVLGSGAGLSFFTYTGKAPLNVFHYLAAFVFLQLLILTILLISWISRRMRRLPAPSLLSSLLADLLIKLFRRASRRLLAEVSAEKREGFAAILGITQTKRIYSPLIFWPILLLIQLFAVGANLGLLTVTLYKVAVTDIAFGWQSTIQFSAEAIFHFVRLLALPWSWLVGSGIAYPSLAEIEGSRIILKSGITHLATPNLISWWPFLCFALCTYGLLPRLTLLLLALYHKGRSLKTLSFDQIVFDRLISRMQTPVVTSQGEPEPATAAVRQKATGVSATATEPGKKVKVLVPDDIFDRCPDDELTQALAGTGYIPVEKIRFAADYEADRLLIERLATQKDMGVPLLILVEAWLPPIGDFITFLHDLRQALGQAAPIFVILLGRPDKKSVFTAPAPDDFGTWRQKIDSLGDPYLGVDGIV